MEILDNQGLEGIESFAENIKVKKKSDFQPDFDKIFAFNGPINEVDEALEELRWACKEKGSPFAYCTNREIISPYITSIKEVIVSCGEPDTFRLNEAESAYKKAKKLKIELNNSHNKLIYGNKEYKQYLEEWKKLVEPYRKIYSVSSKKLTSLSVSEIMNELEIRELPDVIEFAVEKCGRTAFMTKC